MPCQLRVGETEHNAIVLDLSPSGLFVQTTAKVGPGSTIEVVFADHKGEAMVLQVEVARRKAVPAQLLSVAHGGLGVRILDAPESYSGFLTELGIAGNAPCASRSFTRFRVRVSQIGGSRSKRIEVEADDEDSASHAAMEDLGDGWKVLGVDRLD